MSCYSQFWLYALLFILAFQCGAETRVVSPAEASSILISGETVALGSAMDLSGVDSQVAHILKGYYASSLGGPEAWGLVESLRFEGTLRMPEGVARFVAFKKKPNYCKIILFIGERRIAMGYDGEDAWQLNVADSMEPQAMSAAEALNFIRAAGTGNHLLYPTEAGKRIELLGIRKVGEYQCYDLRVTLSDGQIVGYAIDRFSFNERQQVVVNAVSGMEEVTTHTRFEVVGGVSIPAESTMRVGGEFAHEVQLQSVLVNVGVMPWMFSRPSGVSQIDRSLGTSSPVEASSSLTVEDVFLDVPFGATRFDAD